MTDDIAPIVKTQFPFVAARSTADNNHALLSSLLAADAFDELSNIDDYEAVSGYIRGKGQVDESGKTTVGTVFWVYPSGLHGPFHLSTAGVVEQHGALVTVERGVPVDVAVERIKATLEAASRSKTIRHEHIAG